ncbi:MAG: glutamyl-tRNA synthetase [Candidatus Midichloriaceae bacterium]|nr:glutamyl-tRNA synthetase [Candidatus Midichloriaceae bacterium]
MSVVTRFAPSPTGVLHTGSARTALFNYLFARKMGGKFLLRIEDTDITRSKPEHIDAIINNLKWLGFNWDGDITFQLRRTPRHTEVAQELVNRGKAYYCYSSPQEIEEFRQKFPHEKFVSPWRDKSASDAPADVKPVVRLKVEKDGSTTVKDLIQGEITVSNSELDDMILLRSDGTPTYMLAVVVDDYDMKVTHIIRGDDHLTNAFRQKHIYLAMGWQIPEFAHIPLIHDKHGRKLSKREGALGVDTYQELGFLPEAVVNHLLKLGWSHGDQEIFNIGEAIRLFNLASIGKSPARFDMDKLNFINAHYMRAMKNETLFEKLEPFLAPDLPSGTLAMIKKGMDGLKQRSCTLVELAENAGIYISKKTELDDKSKDILSKIDAEFIAEIEAVIRGAEVFNKDSLHQSFEKFAQDKGVKFPFIMQSLRALLLGTFAAPGIFEVMEVLGKEECLNRVLYQISK